MDKQKWLDACAKGASRTFFRKPETDMDNRRALVEEANVLGMDACSALWVYFREIANHSTRDEHRDVACRVVWYLPETERR